MNTRLKELESVISTMIKRDEMSTFNIRHFDNAYNAVNTDELNFIIINTSSMLIQDYSTIKRDLFLNKKEV